jgi:hypothetical protein
MAIDRDAQHPALYASVGNDESKAGSIFIETRFLQFRDLDCAEPVCGSAVTLDDDVERHDGSSATLSITLTLRHCTAWGVVRWQVGHNLPHGLAIINYMNGRHNLSSSGACCQLEAIAVREASEGHVAETEGFEPSIRFKAYDDLANRCLQPLGHVSPIQRVGTL